MRFLLFFLLFVGGLAVYGDDFRILEDRIRESLVKQKSTPEKELRRWMTTQNPDGSWNDINYRDQNRAKWLAAEHIRRAAEMALGWASPSSPLYQNPELGRSLIAAMALWNRLRPVNSNWWWNDLKIPEQTLNILILAAPLFEQTALRQSLLDLKRQPGISGNYTGDNLIYWMTVVLKRAMLEKNQAEVTAAADTIKKELNIVSGSGYTNWGFVGIRADYSYQAHWSQLHFGGYGTGFVQRIVYWGGIWQGTRWQLDERQLEVIRRFMLEGLQWVHWQGGMDMLAIGRHLGRNCMPGAGKAILDSSMNLQQIDHKHAAAYQDFLNRNRPGAANDLVGNKHFWNSDYMVHRRPGWYAAVRMCSNRVCPMEDQCNGDLALGRYLADGVLLLYRDGKEYENITACWDWTRLPGTTLPKTPVYTGEEAKTFTTLKPNYNFVRWTHSKNWRSFSFAEAESRFTGGVSDGTYGAAVYHPHNLDGVAAKKSYFFGKYVIFALGSGINSTSEFPVATTVNNCRWRGEVKQGTGWFWHDGTGYRGNGMSLSTEEHTGDWRYLHGGMKNPQIDRKKIFLLTIEHGLKPRQASYEYLILPGATPEDTAFKNYGKVLANTPELQAVEFDSGVIAAIFHRPGQLNGFSTSTPGAFLIENNRVYAADPSTTLKQMQLSRNGITKTIDLPQGELAGKTVQVTF